MKAAIYMGKEDIEIREIPTPECGDDDVLIKNIYSSICGTECGCVSAWTEYRTPHNDRRRVRS